MRKTVVAVAGAMLLAGGAAAQDGATLYRDPSFRGPAVAVDRANPDLALNFQVFSIRIVGGPWELCPERNFRGRCLTVTATTPDLRRAYGWQGPLQSMRPVGGWGDGGGAVGGPRLKGMAAEFFPAPRRGGNRVAACAEGSATAACAARSADRFCQDAGWRGSAREAMETVDRRVFLADVLCVRSGS